MIAVRPLPPPVVVVGTGRLGRALSAALGASGRPASVVSGRAAAVDPGSALSALLHAGQGTVLLLAVRDDEIERLAAVLASRLPAAPLGAVVLHHSGALGLEVLRPLAARGFATGSCHPLQTFSGSVFDAGRFEGTFFAVDGYGAGLAAAELLVKTLGGRAVSIRDDARGLYHLAASLGANGLTALVAASRDALAAAGLGRREALEALGPLLRTALEEALRLGPEAALTGPASRGDDATLDRHRRALLAWDASRTALLEALLREQSRLAARGARGTGC